jgi:hypothetical protein
MIIYILESMGHIILLLFFFINIFLSAQADVSPLKNERTQVKPSFDLYMKEIPVYPKAKVYDLKKLINVGMKLHLTDQPFDKVASFYVSKLTEKGWVVEFPDPTELKIWMEALNHERNKPPNIMLHLTKPKTKINCNITIGVVKEARSPKDLTIITIYLTDTMLK